MIYLSSTKDQTSALEVLFIAHCLLHGFISDTDDASTKTLEPPKLQTRAPKEIFDRLLLRSKV